MEKIECFIAVVRSEMEKKKRKKRKQIEIPNMWFIFLSLYQSISKVGLISNTEIHHTHKRVY